VRALRDDQIFAKKVKKEKNEGEFEVENFKNLSIKHGAVSKLRVVQNASLLFLI
jgi:hypothetical protein